MFRLLEPVKAWFQLVNHLDKFLLLFLPQKKIGIKKKFQCEFDYFFLFLWNISPNI
jgi:hypothetical protein